MDIRTIFIALDRHQVKYVLVGALGAVAHGARLHTHDVDVCNATDEANLRRIAAALIEMHARLIREPAARPMSSIDLGDWTTLRLDDPSEHHLFTTPFGDIDILPEPFGREGGNSITDYYRLAPHAVPIEAFSLVVQVAPFDYIMSSKVAIGREQDRAAAAELIRVGELLDKGLRPEYGLEQFASDNS